MRCKPSYASVACRHFECCEISRLSEAGVVYPPLLPTSSHEYSFPSELCMRGQTSCKENALSLWKAFSPVILPEAMQDLSYGSLYKRFSRPVSIAHGFPNARLCHSAGGLQGPARSQAVGQAEGHGTKELLITLERAVGARMRVDSELAEAGSFKAEVYPDLPIASSWGELFGNSFKRKTLKESQKLHKDIQPTKRLLIKTVGCQARSHNSLQVRMRDESEAGADGLLILSGSHPAHSLSKSLRRTPDSIALLKLAAKMRQDGSLPQRLSLWAVENPLIHPPHRLAHKVEAGAEVILTQPPLLWPTFEEWWQGIHREGLTSNCKVVVGIPMLTSAQNAAFWLQLCRASKSEGARELVDAFKRTSQDKKESQNFTKAYNAELVKKVLALPGIGGLHVMPLTKAGREQTLDLQADGILPSVKGHEKS